VVLTKAEGVSTTPLIRSTEAVWKYLDNGSDQRILPHRKRSAELILRGTSIPRVLPVHVSEDERHYESDESNEWKTSPFQEFLWIRSIRRIRGGVVFSGCFRATENTRVPKPGNKKDFQPQMDGRDARKWKKGWEYGEGVCKHFS